MDWSKVLDALKLPPKYLIPVVLATGFMLFGSKSSLSTLGLDGLVDSFRSWIGLIFLISTVVVVTGIATQLWSWQRHVYRRRQLRKINRERLHHLTYEEKRILRSYIGNQTKSQVLDYADGVTQELVFINVIHLASTLGSMDGFAYNIQPWAWEYLNQHSHLLEYTEQEEAMDQQRRSIRRRW